MATGTYNGMKLTKGADFSQTFRILNDDGTPADLSGFSARSQLRPYPDSPTAYDFNVEIGPQTVGNYGWFTLSMSSTETAALSTPVAKTFDPTPMFWDLDLIDSLGKISTQLRGTAQVYPQVTKP